MNRWRRAHGRRIRFRVMQGLQSSVHGSNGRREAKKLYSVYFILPFKVHGATTMKGAKRKGNKKQRLRSRKIIKCYV